jgi:hypothetical protein
MKKLIMAAALLIIIPVAAAAQNAAPAYRGQGYVLGGLGTVLGGLRHPLLEQFAFGGEGFIHKGVGLGAEATYLQSGYDGQSALWLGTVNVSYHFRRHAPKGGFDPFIIGGPGIVGPAHKSEGGRGAIAGILGGGANWWFSKHTALRMEICNVDAASNIFFRVGLTFR